MNLQERLAQVKLLVLDHDGVLTDNYVYVNERGEEMCRYSRADGIGIERVKKLGVRVIVLTGEPEGIVDARCKKLHLEVIHCMISPKIDGLQLIMRDSIQTAYVGNDINDLECLKAVGVPIVVNDAEPTLVKKLHSDVPAEFEWWTTAREGGEDAVREVCDMIADAIETIHSFKDISTRIQEGTLVLPEHWAGFWGYRDYSA